MGDCRIRVVIAKSLFDSLPDELSTYCDGDASSVRVASNKTSVSFVRMYSADTTIREVVDENNLLRRLFLGTENSPSQSPSKETETTITEATSEFALWDCTLSPPRDITSWPRQEYPDLQGLKSKTLHAAGLFPSGTWMAIPKGMTPNTFSGHDSNAYVDVQYNNSNGDSNGDSNNDSTESAEKMNTCRTVEFNNPALRLGTSSIPLPSRVMETVSNRFAAEERAEELKRMETSETSITALRRENVQLRAQKELQRVTKLERRIAMLEEQSNNNNSKTNKKKKISDQVLRMLVKSRATGDKNLKDQDRFYFQCLILFDDNNANTSTTDDSEDHDTAKTAPGGAIPSKEYRYFSPQDTFAKIANSVSNNNGRHKANKEFFSEVLCRRSEIRIKEEMQTALPVYRRFPTTMRIYEAQSRGYLSLSENITNYFDDTLIIRCYNDREDATPLIQDETRKPISNEKESAGKGITDSNDEMASADATTMSICTPTAADKKTNTVGNDADTTTTRMTTTFEDAQLSDAIRQMDDTNNKKGTKKGLSAKKSAAALKVRQMKMKSKAKGNKKLKTEDRVFLEVVSISEIGGKPICECYFLSQKDPIERVLQGIGGTGSTNTKNAADHWEFLVPQDDSRYRPIATTSILMKEAEEKKIFKSFDRLILRPKTNQ